MVWKGLMAWDEVGCRIVGDMVEVKGRRPHSTTSLQELTTSGNEFTHFYISSARGSFNIFPTLAAD
jgi:hypothetical protein